jgi:hypothetical protein
MFTGTGTIDVQSQLRQLHGWLAGKPDLSDPVDAVDVVVSHSLCFRKVRHVFAEPRKYTGQALRGQGACRPQHIVERFAGHERRNGAPHELRAHAVLAQPLAVGRRQEQRPHGLWPGPRTTRPGFAPVCSPSFNTCVPLTNTCTTPVEY